MKKRIINFKFFCVFFIILLIVLSLSFISSLNTEDTGFRVDGGQTKMIAVHSKCRMVENELAKDIDIFIGTKEPAEWDSFINNKPTGIILSACTVTFTYKGNEVTYGIVSSGGEFWLDRNLGASRVATSKSDSAAYGDLFQWGRLDDKHQSRSSGTTSVLSSSDIPGHSKFILKVGSPYDWRNPQNNNLWQGVSGTNNPCPSGWRLPTETEWENEVSSWSLKNYNDAFRSPLKLVVAGYRHGEYGSFSYGGSRGYYWSSTTKSTRSCNLYFSSSEAYIMDWHGRTAGFSVRCIKD